MVCFIKKPIPHSFKHTFNNLTEIKHLNNDVDDLKLPLWHLSQVYYRQITAILKPFNIQYK